MESKQYTLIILLDLNTGVHQISNAQPPDCVWAKSFGGPAWDVARSIAIDPEGSGDVYLSQSDSKSIDH